MTGRLAQYGSDGEAQSSRTNHLHSAYTGGLLGPGAGVARNGTESQRACVRVCPMPSRYF
jgi:hypothetical protein